MKGATIYGGRFAAEHPGQLLAVSVLGQKAKEDQAKGLGLLPSYLQSVMEVGNREVPGLGKMPTIANTQAISTLGTAGEALQIAKGLWTGRTQQSDLLANTLTPAASALLAIGTHVDPFTGDKIDPKDASIPSILTHVLSDMPAPIRMWRQIQKADEIEKGNLDPATVLLPNSKSEAVGRWLGPGFGAAVGHPLADYTLNTREARSRAASEARALSTKADSKIELYKSYRDQTRQQAAKVGLKINPIFDSALALAAQREAARAVYAATLGKSESKLNSIERLEADMGLLVRMKKIKQATAKRYLLHFLNADQGSIDSFRRDLGELYFGSVILSAYRSALKARGEKAAF
jgi:hypothetical protein